MTDICVVYPIPYRRDPYNSEYHAQVLQHARVRARSVICTNGPPEPRHVSSSHR